MADAPQLNVLLGIGGGISAYKSVQVASALYQAGHRTYVAMTRSAQQFVTPLSFAGVIRRRVVTDMFAPPSSDDREDIYPHLYPATKADVFMLVPATANLIGKVAHGIGDDIVTTAALSLPRHCRRYICPAMNVEMWAQPVVRDNMARLIDYGWNQIGPAEGHLACGTTGAGRMTEPADIVAHLQADLAAADSLAGKRLLILSGPTVEHLDPVRFMSNHSSGKMGAALAQAALAAGASVDFVTGPVPPANLPSGAKLTLHQITSAEEMLAAGKKHFSAADGAIFVAAVADYQAVRCADQKLPKEHGRFSIELEPTPDIAATLAAEKRPGQVCLGFALETEDGPAKASDKLARKHLDGIVLNDTSSFGATDGTFHFITADGADEWGRLPKRDCAERIIRHLADRLLG